MDNPGKLRAQTLSYQGSDAMEKDRRAAVNEAECAQTSGLSQTARALDKRYTTALRRQYAADYETVERLKQAALPVAGDIVRRG